MTIPTSPDATIAPARPRASRRMCTVLGYAAAAAALAAVLSACNGASADESGDYGSAEDTSSGSVTFDDNRGSVTELPGGEISFSAPGADGSDISFSTGG